MFEVGSDTNGLISWRFIVTLSSITSVSLGLYPRAWSIVDIWKEFWTSESVIIQCFVDNYYRLGASKILRMSAYHSVIEARFFSSVILPAKRIGNDTSTMQRVISSAEPLSISAKGQKNNQYSASQIFRTVRVNSR